MLKTKNKVTRAKGIILQYEVPGMYQKIEGGKHISAIKTGERFKASDGRYYEAIMCKANRNMSGPEYDLSARCLEDSHIYVFHCPAKKDLWFLC